MLSRLVVIIFLFFIAGRAAADPVRGAYLARAADCQSCHTAKGGQAFAGGRGMRTPFGEIYTTNITPDIRTGIGAYSLHEFDRAVRHGAARDGHHLYPAMPYPSFRRLSDQDVADLYDYFIHEVTPVARTNTPTRLPFPLNLRWGLIFWNWLFKPHHVYTMNKTQDAQWNRGAYLVETLGHCGACHTPRGLFFEARGTTASASHFLTGGTLDYWHASNLRDRSKGPGSWRQADIAAFLKTGQSHGTIAFGSMAEVVENSTQYLTDADRAAIARYISDLPKVRQGHVTPAYRTAPTVEWPGAGRYAQMCAECHGVNGKGRTGVPDLAGNSVIQAPDGVSVVHMILKGGRAPRTVGGAPPKSMPGFEGALTDREIAELANFVRQNWGNRAPSINSAIVGHARLKLRRETATRIEELDAELSKGGMTF